MVKLASGRSFTIKHSKNIACSLTGQEMIIYDDEGMHLIEMLLFEVIEPVTSPAQSKVEGNGG